MKPRLLIIGGSGFIGSHIIRHALSYGWDVCSLSLSGKAPKGVEGLSVDLLDDLTLRHKLKGQTFHYVINCGGYVDHALFSATGRNVLNAHFSGLLNLVQALDRSILKSFINIGSSDEYGDVHAPQSESIREHPISPYSIAKTAASHFLQMLNKTEGFPAVTIRLFLTYGPGQSTNRFLPQIIKGCIDDEQFPASEGYQLRDFCYIDDVVRAIFIALKTPEAHGEVINIASGQPISIRHVIEKVQAIIGKGQPQFGMIPYRSSENMSLYADISKAEKLLKWQPTTDLEQGLVKTVEWARNIT